jgi:hypothetical protein
MKYDPTVYPTCTVPAAEVARVKGLGFLRDKRTADRFNARVITRNGKISADEMYAIADAARRFGTGEIAFTTRQTAEVQGIPFENIQLFCTFLSDHGLTVGGTVMNKLVIAANGGKMPVYPTVSQWIGYYKDGQLDGSIDSLHVLLDGSSKLPFLADYIDLGLCILSPGDVLIHAFASIVIYYTVKAVCPRRGTTETMGSLDS